MLGERDSDLRVMVLSGLARACAFVGDHDRSSQLRRDSIAMARRLDDRPALATVLMRAYWAKGNTGLDEILAMLTESRDLAAELGDSELQAEAMEWRIAALIALGDLEAARAELAVVYEMASRVGQPFIIHVAEHYRSAIALCDGRLAEAEATAERSFEWGRLLTGPRPVRLLRRPDVRDPPRAGPAGRARPGRADPGGRRRRAAASGARASPRCSPSSAWTTRPAASSTVCAAAGSPSCAQGCGSRRSPTWPTPAALVGDSDMAADLYPELTPYAGGIVTIGHGVACYGAADRYLGIVAAVSGERELACAHLETALAVDRGMGAWTWLAHTQYHLGRLLLADRDGDRVARPRADAGGRRARRADRHARAARPHPGAGRAARRGGRRRTGSRRASCRSCASSPRACPTARSAPELVVSEHTAANHVRSILRKTGCANRTEAASYAYRRGLTRSPAAE